jgi:TonB family protein
MEKVLLITLFSLLFIGVKAQDHPENVSDPDRITIKEPTFDAKITSNAEQVFTDVETQPTFSGGGMDKFYAYLQLNMVYPPGAVKKRIQGKVFVSFVVEKDGSITNIKILEGVSPEIDAEAGRVVGNSPKWLPGRQNDIPVRTQFALPITFKLPGEINADSKIAAGVRDPAFPGGIEKFYYYLSKNMHYPKKARRGGVQGKVYISFVVEKDGSLSEIKVVSGLSRETDNEAVRLIKSCPKWMPGIQNGQPVRAAYTAAVPFQIDN